MVKGISIHFGINNLESAFYRNTAFKNLKSCINDAEKMKELAEKKGFEAFSVLADAKKQQAKDLITDVAKNRLVSGDICLITFSGHGGQIEDRNRDERFDRHLLDETWCFADKPMSDDEILKLWTDFKEGVRVLVISDSCHSGGIIDFYKLGITNPIRSLLLEKGFDFNNFRSEILYENGLISLEPGETGREKNKRILQELNLSENIKRTFSNAEKTFLEQKVKSIPKETLEHLCFVENKEEYEKDLFEARKGLIDKLNETTLNHVQDLKKASIILLSACEDWQITKDGKDENDNGDFTKALLNIWSESNEDFSGNYNEFRSAIFNKLQSMQKPQIPTCLPTGTPNEQFLNQNPFKIDFSV